MPVPPFYNYASELPPGVFTREEEQAKKDRDWERMKAAARKRGSNDSA